MTKRLSLILSEQDQQALAPFIEAGTGQNEALQRWAAAHGAGSVRSAAAALRVLLQAGVEALRDEVLDAGYTELARIYNGAEEGDERRSARARYLSRTEAAL